MIAIYANWTGNCLAVGATVAEARAKLTGTHCAPDTRFGADPSELTALDTGPQNPLMAHPRDKLDLLHVARGFFPQAEG